MPGEPVAALSQNVRALLLLGMRGLFLKVSSWRSKKRQSTEDEKRPAMAGAETQVTFIADGTFTGTITAVATPELSTWAMMGLGFAGLGFAGYRRARAA